MVGGVQTASQVHYKTAALIENQDVTKLPACHNCSFTVLYEGHNCCCQLIHQLPPMCVASIFPWISIHSDWVTEIIHREFQPNLKSLFHMTWGKNSECELGYSQTSTYPTIWTFNKTMQHDFFLSSVILMQSCNRRGCILHSYFLMTTCIQSEVVICTLMLDFQNLTQGNGAGYIVCTSNTSSSEGMARKQSTQFKCRQNSSYAA